MSGPRPAIVKTLLAAEEKRDIVSRRCETGAANNLAKEYHISKKRVYEIWELAGVRWEKSKTPSYAFLGDEASEEPPAGAGAGSPPERKSAPRVRKSAAGRYVAREPASPVHAEEDMEELEKDMGSLEAGNSSGEVYEDAHERLDELEDSGNISPGAYSEAVDEVDETYKLNAAPSPPARVSRERKNGSRNRRDPERRPPPQRAPPKPRARVPAPRAERPRSESDESDVEPSTARPARVIQRAPSPGQRRADHVRGRSPSPEQAPAPRRLIPVRPA